MMLTPPLFWLLIGIALCLTEVFLPTAFIAFVLGLSALLVAAVATILPFALQVVLWIGLSILMVLLSRRFVNKKAARKLDAIEAETLTEILPGQLGRVLYEGNSWAARCNDSQLRIAAHERVYVVGRQGTTLFVMPRILGQVR